MSKLRYICTRCGRVGIRKSMRATRAADAPAGWEGRVQGEGVCANVAACDARVAARARKRQARLT